MIKRLVGAKSQIDESFAAAADASGIILDLRNNGGGLDLLSIYVAQHLVPGDFIYYETERRDSPLLRSLPRYHDMDARAFGTRLPSSLETGQALLIFRASLLRVR
ncbi:MAG: S41 family peptidase [Planctomycetaceae bacterium]